MNTARADVDSGSQLQRDEYFDHFDAEEYLSMYESPDCDYIFEYVIQELVRIVIENKSKGEYERALEFGGGPSLLLSFILAQQVKSIVFCDYTPQNLVAVTNWMKRAPNAYDWSSFFDKVLREYQKQSGNESVKRSDWENKLREALENGRLSSCDANAVDCPVLGGEPNQYDIVLSAFCLESACLTYDAYKATVKRLYALLKSGGLLILLNGRNQTHFDLKEHRFPILTLNEKMVSEALKEAGFVDIHIKSNVEAPAVPASEGYADGIMLFTAHKPKTSV